MATIDHDLDVQVLHPGRGRLLLLLHGYGMPVDDLVDRLHLLDPAGRCTVVVPRGPYEHKGKRIWHRALTTAPQESALQYRESLGRLDALLAWSQEHTGLAASEAIVGGFSQGGGLGFGLLLAADIEHRPAAAFGICSFPPAFPGFRVDLAAAAGRRCFLASAQQDHFAPIEGSRGGASTLRASGLELTYVEVDTGHEVTDDSAVLTGHWIDAVAADREPEGFEDLLSQVGQGPGYYAGLWTHT